MRAGSPRRTANYRAFDKLLLCDVISLLAVTMMDATHPGLCVNRSDLCSGGHHEDQQPDTPAQRASATRKEHAAKHHGKSKLGSGSNPRSGCDQRLRRKILTLVNVSWPS